MADEKKHSPQEPAQSPTQPPAPTEPLSEQDRIRIILEQARQQVKPIAKQEREGEKINRELLNFRMRRANDP
jgi:hypothetical protein